MLLVSELYICNVTRVNDMEVLFADPLRFIQIWVTPRSRGLQPNYGSYSSSEEQRLNQWYAK
jgi:redox-sensitive bicupin YhaK (pirin superfamily)